MKHQQEAVPFSKIETALLGRRAEQAGGFSMVGRKLPIVGDYNQKCHGIVQWLESNNIVGVYLRRRKLLRVEKTWLGKISLPESGNILDSQGKLYQCFCSSIVVILHYLYDDEFKSTQILKLANQS